MLISSLFISNIYAQRDSTKTNTGEKSTKKSDRIMLNLYTDMWQEVGSEMTVSAYSPGVDIYGMYDIPFGKSKFSFAFGLGFGTHNMRSNAMPADEVKFDTVSATTIYTGKTIFEKIPDYVNNKEIKYDINKFSLTYFDIPLELRFNTQNKKGKSIKFAIGGKLGYLINDHIKYKGNDITGGEGDVKFKTFKIKNLELLIYGATIRLGYDMYNIFAYYSLSKIFKADKGPEIFPISVGICITPF